MRVCFFAERQVGIGSVAAVLERQARAQSAVDVTWCDVTYHRSGGALERLPILPHGAKAALRALQQTGEGLRSGPFDALFFLTHNPAVLRQYALTRTPACVWTDVTPVQLDALATTYAHPVSRSRVVRLVKRAAVTSTFRLASRCLGWSEWARRSFVEDYGVPRDRTAVVPPGIDVSLWDAPARDADPARPLRLAFVGGHFERKGGALLLDVFRQRFRGRCELAVATRDDIAEEPGVRVHRGLAAGSDGLRRLLAWADAFVLPTLADCHSIASLEAMAAGLPVVLTSVGAGPEIVEEGRSGFVVPPGDGDALARAIEALVRDRPRAGAMGARGRAIVERDFDAAVMASRIFDHLREVAAGRGAAAG
ncbi:MAG TPA: glycosyltransferase family 4 protein [Polyangiaceae bacterium]|nr:glycosyltransferase family 4 protein [Polyangiaceae bacterium]